MKIHKLQNINHPRVNNKQNTLLNFQQRLGKKKISIMREKINYESVEEASSKNLISKFNHQTSPKINDDISPSALNVVSEDEEKNISYICDKINYDNVKKAVDKKLISDLNNQTFFTNRDGTFPSLLYAALDNNDTDLVDFLIDQGINLNVIEEGRKPFIFDIIMTPRSQYFGCKYMGESYLYDVIRRSIKAGLDVNAPRWEGYSPLSYSLLDINEKLAELFINAGADVNPMCGRERCGGCSPISRAVYAKLDKIIDLLLMKGCKINSKNCRGGSLPLNTALVYNNIEMARRFINIGADVEAKDWPDGNSLRFAMHRVITAEFLLNNTFVDVNSYDERFNRTALHWIAPDNEEGLDRLLNANPDVNVVDTMNDLAVDRIENYESKIMIQKIKNHLVKLRAAGFYLIDRNIAAISGEVYEEFGAKCCQEVNSMKETKISPASHINFHDVLFMTYEKLALCLESLDDQGTMQSNFQEKFPLYAGMIEFKFTRANLWMKLRAKLNAAVYRLFNDNLPSTIMEKIFSYFSIPELMKL